MQLEDSPRGWARYVEQLVFQAVHPTEQQNQDLVDISRGRPIGTDGWQRTLAREHRHRALESDLPREEIMPLRQARWIMAFEQALASRGLTSKDIAPTPRMPRWKVELAATIRKASGAPYRWIAESLGLDRPDSLRAAICWLGRR